MSVQSDDLAVRTVKALKRAGLSRQYLEAIASDPAAAERVVEQIYRVVTPSNDLEEAWYAKPIEALALSHNLTKFFHAEGFYMVGDVHDNREYIQKCLRFSRAYKKEFEELLKQFEPATSGR
jgi:hypothetical protein